MRNDITGQKSEDIMSKIAFIYPGQGAQSPMMGKEIIESFSEAREIFDIANEQLDFDLYDMCHTDNALLNDTAYTQPALLAVSAAITEVIGSYGIKPDYTAGLSLGEYSALVASGVMNYRDALGVVRKRGQLMEKAGQETKGAMAAILGSNREAIQSVLDQVDGYVAFANFNNPKQIVLSGEKEALEACYPLFKEAKIKAIPLNVSGAFHSNLMQSAAVGLTDVLSTIVLDEAKVPYLTNVTGNLVGSSDATKGLLVQQLTGSVLWEQNVMRMIDLGVETFVEIGPGKTLAGLIKKIDRKKKVISVSCPESLEQLKQYLEVV